MRSSLGKITTTFIVLALLPVSFIVYELSTLNKNEEIVREIYKNQLDAILYSVNQYSDDIMSSWANRINISLSEDGLSKGEGSGPSRFSSLFIQMTPVKYIYFSDLESKSELVQSSYDAVDDFVSVKNFVDNMIVANREKITRLITYQRAGFRKLEAIDTTLNGQSVPIVFVLDGNKSNYKLGVIIIDLPVFIQQILGPKMQAISQDKFIISAFRYKDRALVYSTGSVNPDNNSTVIAEENTLNNESQKKAFWLLPGYYLGITLKGATIDDLVKDRVTTSLIILSMLILILTIGIVFLYRNIRREVYLSQAKSEFVSNVSHEIRTPLSLISMYAETLEMGRVTEERKKEYYSVIAKETARLSRIVNRILNFSQVEANKKKYDIKPVQLNEICTEVADSYSHHLQTKGFSFQLIKDETLPMISGDRESITEALINLIDNAIKYSKDKKSIIIRTLYADPYVSIEVKDEGIGIQKNYHQEIFEQFFRAPTGDIHNTKGSGLGLTLVKKTVEAHHGKIKVESAVDKGSTFKLYFPKRKAEV